MDVIYIENYSNKENYITRTPEPMLWRHHANGEIIHTYQKYIRGYCGDLGCNHGACTLLLLDFHINIKGIYGFDLNNNAIEVAKHTTSKLNPIVPVKFVTANLLELPVKDNVFDFLMSFHTLEHIYPNDVDTFISEIYRILKPGGILLISIPYDRAYPDPAHVGFYKVDDICELFEKHHFKVIECMKDNRWNEKNLLTAVFEK